ncbi:polyphosphate--glucose phosphotransferase [Rhizomonospora bruguierae]|uniref:polyphosphate--glucose phosphotransferase n=1 Tax=Rhizomonospora bruguierae TaxID=1581705 RepID=UPI0020C0A853|nr:ROK family protein [Micromonospora sp. NBRC 107566]
MILGIDVGGSGIKGAPVDLVTGALAEQRHREPTPHRSDVARVVATVRRVAEHFGPAERVGVTFPSVVVGGVTKTAANVDRSWIDAPAAELLSAALDRPVTVVNDADAAGIAEMTYGAGRGRRGTVIMLTFGTGIGSAVFLDGRLLPNTELGHLELRGEDAELRASDRAREQHDLGWDKWARRVEEYLRHVESLFQPDLFIIGGGVSKKAEKFFPAIDIRTPMVTAELLNNAGIVGAAIAAHRAAGA